MTETTPSPTWSGRRLQATYCAPTPGGPKIPGTVTISTTSMIVNTTENKIFPAGKFIEQPLNIVEGEPSFDVLVPVTDDPDNVTAGAKLSVIVILEGWGRMTYVLPIPASSEPLDLSDTIPLNVLKPATSTVTLFGKPNGVATLDAEGKIPRDQIPGEAGGLPAGDEGDVLTYTAAGAWEPRVFTVQQANVAGLTTALAKKADVGHGHSISGITGLATILDGKAPIGHTHTVADLNVVPATGVRVNGVDYTPAPTGIVDLGEALGGGLTATETSPGSGLYRFESATLTATETAAGSGLYYL